MAHTEDSTTLITTSDHRALAPSQPLDQHPAIYYLASLKSERSRQVMRDDLAIIAALVRGVDPDSMSAPERRALVLEVPWHELRISHTNTIRAALMTRYESYRTINRMLSALRGVLKACWELGLMSGEDYYRARGVGNVQGATLPAGRDLTPGERAALFDACSDDPTPAGARDAALLACADAGLRRAEIARLDLEDVDLDNARLRVRGKGNKERWAPLELNGQTLAIRDWLAVRGDEPGPLLWPVNKGGRLIKRRMTSQAIYNVMRKRGEQAGVENFSPHDFRRTLAGDLLDAGADIVTVQKILGHADVNTTSRYDRRPEKAKQRAANLRHTPYRGRRQKPLPGA